MAFIDILMEMVEGASGGVAAALMGTDGIPVEQYSRPGSGSDIEAIGVEYGKVIEEVKRASEMLKLGAVDEIHIDSGGSEVLIRLVTPEYYLAFLLDGRTGLGKARYLLRKASEKTEKELSL